MPGLRRAVFLDLDLLVLRNVDALTFEAAELGVRGVEWALRAIGGWCGDVRDHVLIPLADGSYMLLINARDHVLVPQRSGFS